MIDYIGDISEQDAEVLKAWAEDSKNILEFGVGASTQVLGAYTQGKLLSIDTERSWMEKTAVHLQRLRIEVGKVRILPYDMVMNDISFANANGNVIPSFDLVFDDGVDNLRRDFAFNIWPHIVPNGWLLFHDQRRKQDWDNAAALIDKYWQEIGLVYYNHEDSNITCIQKRATPAIYDNWQLSEGNPPSKYGLT